MSPRQASQTDPIQRLLLLSAYEALEQAGYNPDNPGSKKIATFFAQSSDDWREVNAGQSIDTYMIPGGIRAFFPGIVNYHFGWEGPAISVDTACSGSAASVDLACSALLSNKCDAALVGGGNILTTSDMFAGLSRAGVLSPTGSCKTWDQGADGYCRADAVAVLVLKRFKDAVANRDNILAVVRGAATNHAPDASSITHPHAPSQAKLVNTILRGADVRPDEIDYVEMHGTGTQAGDVAETSTALAIFGGHRSPNRPLYIGTVKPNVGHSEAGSGVTSVIKSIMMFQKSVIPPHIGIKTVRNPDLPDIEGSNILIPLYKVPFKAHPSSDGKRRILINNYNITSGNTSLLLEDGPSQSACENEDPRSYHVIVVSGNSHNALLGNASRLESYLMRNPDVKVSDLSYSLTARRMHHKYRYAYATSNISDLRTMIARDLEAQAQGMPTQTVPVIFMFTGQGSLYVGMGAKLSRESSTFRNSILQSERTCQSMGMPSFVQLIIDSEVNLADFDTVQTQLALVAVEIALTDMWRSWGVTPSAVVGHSLGEYPALYTAGVLSRADMFLMVGQRARLLQNNCVIGTHAMLAVNLDSKRLGGILQDLGLSTCEIACYNGPQANVVSGPTDQITTLGRVLKNQGTQATELKVPYAFHSAQIDALLEGFRALAQTVPFQNPQVPVASTLTGTVHYSEDVFDADYFVRHAREPVRFMRAAQELESNGIATSQTLWMEMGSTPVCLGMLKSVLSLSAERSLPSLAPKKDAWEILSSSLAKAYKAGIKIKWHEYHRDYESSLTLLDLPSYAFDLKSYWIQYQGDWVVRKHRAALSSASTPTPQVPELKSTTLQKIISEEFGSDQASVQFTTDIQEEKLAATISGHLVGDFALCPSSIYADMAITAASYIWKRLRPNDVVPVFDVSAMSVRAPLVKKNSISSQVIKITAHKQAGSDDINMTVCSPDGEPKSHYADWAVKRGDANAWMQEWAKTSYLYQSRIDYLKDPARIGIHRLLESTVYKLFSVIVAYGEKFRGMQEVFMDGALSEATSRITFKSEPSDGKFVLSPYWFDALAHLSGFVLNAGDLTPPDLVYISHGWDGMRFAKPLSEDGNYQSYVRMQATHEKNVMAGDVYILCDDVIVAVIEGLRFQAMKKTVMRSLLSRDIATSHAGDTKTPKPARKVKPVIKTNDLPPAQNNKGGVTSLIAAELGVEPAEMRGDVSLADLGVDSLLIIEIQAKLKSELDIDVPSSFLAQPSTMIDLERYVENLQGHGSPGFTPTSSPTDDHFNSNDASSSGTPLTQPSPRLDPRLETSELKGIIAQELGVSVDEIDPHAQLSDLGLDSLLTIALLDQIREKTGKSLPVDFFVTYPTWTNIAAFIDAKAPIPMSISLPEPLPQRPVKSSPPIQPKKPERLAKRSASPVKTVQSSELASPPTHCSTTLLHGANDSHSASASLVLFPDGTGSPAPYTSLPSLRPDLSIIGLSSPFIGNPSTYTLSLNEVATIYAATINRAVPTGVLILGGLSIGGIFAYETARQLLSQGREIKGLLLLDAPCPSTAQAIKPNTLVQILDLLGDMDVLKRPGSKDVRLPAHIREHFFRSATALDRHVPATPSDALRRLPCEAIWATCGVLDSLPDAEYMDTVARVDGKGPSTDWMLRKRTTAGPQGWEALLDKVECHEIGTDHFRFCRQPHVSILFTPCLGDRACGIVEGWVANCAPGCGVG